MEEVEKQRELLEDIERRLTRCEEAVGGCYDMGPTKAAVGGGGGGEASGGSNRTATAAGGSSLVMMTCRLHHELSKLCRGNLQELQDRYRQLKVWLESDQSAVPKLLLTLQAKRMYVLQHEEMLRTTAARVRQMQELEEFINPVDLSAIETYTHVEEQAALCPAVSFAATAEVKTELDSYKERLRALDTGGNLLAERAARVEEKLMEIAHVYNSTVTMMASVFEEWHQHLSELEEKGGADVPPQ